MRKTSINTSWLLPLVGSLFLGVPAVAKAVLGNQDPQQPDSYSSTTHDQPIPSTADQPKLTSSDRTIEQKIRKAIYADKGLSAAAHRVKIVAQDGKVTLQGSVRSGGERSNIFTKATAVAGESNVINRIEVMPSKQ